MSTYITLVVFAVVIIGLLSFSRRAKRRQADAQAARADKMAVGTDVMTTSGLYGTITSLNPDDSVQLSIAPGVEVRWAVAALRDVAELPDNFRRPQVVPEPEDDGDRRGVGVRLDKPGESGDGQGSGHTGP